MNQNIRTHKCTYVHTYMHTYILFFANVNESSMYAFMITKIKKNIKNKQTII